MSDPFVSVLVVTLNGRAHLETCLPSLLAQDYPRDRYEILVVDNASTDGSVELVRQQFSGVGIVAHRRNLGFAGAYHAAIPTARGELLAFLNNDTRVEPSWLSELVRATRDQGAAAAGSKMLGWDGSTIDFCGGIVSLLGHAWQDQHGHPASSGGSATKKLLFACGGAMLVDRAAYDDAGGFDPEYFAYFEDVDLGWRMALRGHTTVLAPTSIVYHRVPRNVWTPRLCPSPQAVRAECATDHLQVPRSRPARSDAPRGRRLDRRARSSTGGSGRRSIPYRSEAA